MRSVAIITVATCYRSTLQWTSKISMIIAATKYFLNQLTRYILSPRRNEIGTVSLSASSMSAQCSLRELYVSKLLKPSSSSVAVCTIDCYPVYIPGHFRNHRLFPNSLIHPFLIFNKKNPHVSPVNAPTFKHVYVTVNITLWQPQ